MLLPLFCAACLGDCQQNTLPCDEQPRDGTTATVEVFGAEIVGQVNRQILGTATSSLYREPWRQPERLDDPTLLAYFEDLDPELFVLDNTMLAFPFYPESTGTMEQRLTYMQLLQRVGVGPFDCRQDCGDDLHCKLYCAADGDPAHQRPPHKGYEEILRFVETMSPKPKLCMRIPTLFTTLLDANVYDGLDLRQLKINIDPQTAVDLLEYLNGNATTPLGQLRASNGHPEAYDVHCFMLGNELWVNYVLADMPMEQIVSQTRAFATAMRTADPSVELGFNLFALVDYPGALWPEHFAPGMEQAYAKYMTFNDQLLAPTADVLDFVTFHVYGFGAGAGLESNPEPSSFTDAQWRFSLALPELMQRHDYAGGLRSYVDRFRPELNIAIDEFDGASGSQGGALYNAEFRLYLQRSGIAFATNWASGLFEPHTRFGLVKVWEDSSQAPVRRPTYYALQMLAEAFGDDVIRSEVTAPTFDTEAINDGALAWPVATAIPGLSSFASRANQKLTVFLVNRLLATDLDVRVELHDLVASGEASLTVLSAPAPECTNEQQADTVVSVRSQKTVEATGLTVTVPAHGLLLLSVDVQ